MNVVDQSRSVTFAEKVCRMLSGPPCLQRCAIQRQYAAAKVGLIIVDSTKREKVVYAEMLWVRCARVRGYTSRYLQQVVDSTAQHIIA